MEGTNTGPLRRSNDLTSSCMPSIHSIATSFESVEREISDRFKKNDKKIKERRRVKKRRRKGCFLGAVAEDTFRK